MNIEWWKEKAKGIGIVIWSALGLILAFFSYSYFTKRKEAEARVEEKIQTINENEAVIVAQQKVVIENQETVHEAVQKAEDIKLKPAAPTPDIQASIDDWNKN